MPMIDTEHLKPGLQRVADSDLARGRAGAQRGQCRDAALDQVDQAREAFQTQCQQFYGYIQQAVATAEAKG